MNRFRVSLAALFCAVGFAAFGGPGAWADDKADGEKELKKFQGTWTFESIEADGKKLPADMFKGMTVTFEGDKYFVKLDDKVIEVATQKLDPSKTPKTLDTTVTDGPNKGTVYLCIYEFSEEALKICFDPEGKKRPTESKGESGFQTLVLRKRVKK
jgi:uncharacterized protein (TIGR03067 family)